MQIPRICLLLLCLSLCSIILGQLPPPANIEILRGIVYATPEQEPLKLDIFRPMPAAGATPVVLAIHGGSWVRGARAEMQSLAEALAGQGYAVVSVDYRLAPRFTYPAQLDDVRAAARWVQAHAEEYHFDMRRFSVLGASAGGQLAALLAVKPDAEAPAIMHVITLAGPMDFQARAPSLQAKIAVKLYLGAEREAKPDLYAQASPITYVSPDDPPFLLIHGSNDPVVPPAQSTRMQAALQAVHVPAQLMLVPHAKHLWTLPDGATGREMLAAMVKYLATDMQPDTPVVSNTGPP